MTDQFIGTSVLTLRRRLANTRARLKDSLSQGAWDGSGSHCEKLRERIADLRNELARRDITSNTGGEEQ